MINPALSPLHREFHQKDAEEGILIAALSTFPKTLTFPLLPNTEKKGVSVESGRPPTLGLRVVTHTHIHTRSRGHRKGISFRWTLKVGLGVCESALSATSPSAVRVQLLISGF